MEIGFFVQVSKFFCYIYTLFFLFGFYITNVSNEWHFFAWTEEKKLRPKAKASAGAGTWHALVAVSYWTCCILEILYLDLYVHLSKYMKYEIWGGGRSTPNPRFICSNFFLLTFLVHNKPWKLFFWCKTNYVKLKKKNGF